MKGKQLIILTGVAATLCGLAVWSTRSGSQQGANTGIGQRILPGLKDQINDVTTLSLQSPASTVTVSRLDGIWRVPSKWNYPADFGKVRESLNTLADLKALQAIRTSPAERAELQLLTAADKGATNQSQCATRVQLLGPAGKTIALLHLGKTRARPGQTDDMGMGGGYPDSRYVMTDEGKTSLTGELLQDFMAPEKSWLDMEFVSLNDILSIEIRHPSQAVIKAERKSPTDDLLLQGQVPAGKDVDQTKLNQVASAFNYLRFDDIADPKSPPETTGLDKPVICQARTQKGEVVTFRIGQAPSGEPKRYVSVSVAFEAPPLPPASGTNQEAAVKARMEQDAKAASEAKTLNEKLSPWIYVFTPETAEAMTPALNGLFKDKPKPEEKKDENKP